MEDMVRHVKVPGFKRSVREQQEVLQQAWQPTLPAETEWVAVPSQFLHAMEQVLVKLSEAQANDTTPAIERWNSGNTTTISSFTHIRTTTRSRSLESDRAAQAQQRVLERKMSLDMGSPP